MHPIESLDEIRLGGPAADAQPLRILLVEDDPEDQLLLRDMLRDVGGRAYRLDCVDSVDAALVAIEGGEHDVYLVDYRLGARDGAEFLRLNGQRPRGRPVIMLTGSDDPALDRELQCLGAADYLVKGRFNAALLERSIRYALERQKVLDALREGEARYRALFDGNPLPMWVQSIDDGHVLAVNEAALRAYGYHRAGFLALQPARDLVASAHHDGSSYIEHHRRRDGNLIDVAVTVHDLAFEGRAAQLVVAENLTRMNQVLRLAARSEATLRAVLEDSADALLVVGEEDVVLYLNAAARRMFGTAAAVGLPVPLPGPWVPGRCDEVDRIDDQGEERRLELHVSATEWDGQPARLIALRDLTERRSAEEGLLLSRRAMESSANGIVIADARDPRQPLIYVNPAFERITGYRAGEVLGSNCRFLQGPQGDQPELKVLREALPKGQGATVVLRNFRKDGTPFWNELSVSPVRNAEGTVTHFVGIQNDITERREKEAEILHSLTHDRLTGLPSRNQVLIDRLGRDMAQALRNGRAPAMLYVDLDQFKEINDTLGRAEGDLVLVEVVRRLRECLSPCDTLARMGGDEFLVLLPDLAQPEDAAVVAGKLLEAVAQPYEVEGQELFCSCSIGMAHATPTSDDPRQLAQQADLAMQAAKRAGRNNVQYYRAELAERSSDRLELRTRLQNAIARQEFELYYQPQMDVAGQRICGLEALVRWQHPTLGQISPGRFIPVAEDTGQIVAIGEWVLNEACRQHRQWLDHGLLDGPVAVNVSGVQFQRAGFVEQVEAALARHGLPSDRLELELTESVMMDAGGATTAKLSRLRELGVRLAIDDFGTGFSSLAYLKRLPIDKIKIDRSFVNDITHDSNDASITLSVIAIAHHLRMKVVAEGVETAAQLSFLKRHLCDQVQGFLIARPLPAMELERFLAGFRPPGAEAAAGEAAGPTLLLVDDEPNILRALTRTLRRDGYRILTAGGAAEAFEVLAENEVHVILSDQRMPKVCGTDFLSEVKSLYPDTVRLVLSGYTDLASVTEAINRGAIYRFLTKPWVDEQLRSHVREAFVHQQRRLSAAVLA